MKKYLLLSMALMGMSVLGWGQNVFQEVEPNNTFFTANTVELSSVNTTITGQITPANDNDVFEIQVTRTGVLSIQMTNPIEFLTLEVFKQTQNLIRGVPTTTQNVPIRICEAGKIYIRLRPLFSNVVGTEPYTLTVSYDTTDVHECNQSLATATLYTGPMSGAINGDTGSTNFFDNAPQSRDEDWFRFTVDAPIVTITITGVPNNIRIQGMVEDEFGSEFLTINNSRIESVTAGTSATGQFNNLEPGKEFILKIKDNPSSPFSLNNNPNLYTLTINGAVTSLSPSLLAGRLRVYPNPARDQLVVDLSELPIADQRGTLYVYNTLGQLLRTEPIPTPTHRLDVQALPPGLLLLEYRTHGQRITQTVLRE